MKHIFIKLFLISTGCIILMGHFAFADEFIAGHTVARESVLRSIPSAAIETAKNSLHVLYCGTSHSTQVVDGMRGLMQYKAGDESLFSVTFDGNSVPGSLDIHYRKASGTDLSHDSMNGSGHTGYFNGTVSYLDSHPHVNVVMWSWCSIEGHDVSIYLDNFQELIHLYKAGGSKGRTSADEVAFVFMTGYARGNDGDTPEPPYIKSPYQNYKRILDYCRSNGYSCLDYWSQDVYEYETDTYKPGESGNDNVQHKAYFDTHQEGVHWFATRNYSTGAVEWPAHCEGTPQHITSNRRAYAAWWIMARLAGWNPSSTNTPPVLAPVGDKSTRCNDLLEFTVAASDPDTPDTPDTLTYSAEPLPGNADFDSALHTFTWIPETGDIGDHQVTFTVVDNGSPQGRDEETITVDNQENHAPELDMIDDKTVKAGELVEFVISAADPDTGDVLSYTARSLPAGAEFDSGSHTFSWLTETDDVGSHTVTFVVVDNGTPQREDNEAVTLTVTGNGSDNGFSDGSCVSAFNDLSLFFPCVQVGKDKFQFAMNFLSGLTWQMEVDSLAMAASDTGCLSAEDTLGFYVPCCRYGSTTLRFTMRYKGRLNWSIDPGSPVVIED